MWRKLCKGEENRDSKQLFISFTTENGYRIYITDYINIWWAYYSKNEFLNILKRSNDDLEMESDDQLLQLGLRILLQPEDLKKLTYTLEDKTLNISMALSYKFPIYLDMKLREGSREMFFANVTQQLLKTVDDLRRSESELRFLLIKKDKEIEEYKTETDVRLAMYLKTGVFRDEEHMGKHTLYEKHFGTAEVSNCLLEKIVVGTEDRVVVKQENQVKELRLKVEPDSQLEIKTEPHVTDIESNSEPIKREIKNEPQNIISPQKKRKMLRI